MNAFRSAIAGVLLLTAFSLHAQGAEEASWIAHPGITGDEYGVYHFRQTLELEEKPEQLNVQVSADNRYRLYVNGVSVIAGPQRSDVMHWRYEDIDLAPFLREGKNVIAAVVWHWGEHKPVAQHSFRTGFLIRGASAGETLIDTGTSAWKSFSNEAYRALPPEELEEVRGLVAAASAVGPASRLRGR